ncbi:MULTISPECIES: hypothetical protein [unclassified Lactococcus]|uniref:hypothetical protein n=1 Tax=unclassified Lactococcus TaxID=2643510 RepID=UPI0011C94814|nr:MULTISPECIES: hypothetical protein [unclassified Lactococcus]MQW21987.1 hypothetical protein [Lactococcus sp. dk101]TXK36832.1 hypothetical protein FVP42_10675 [Lactococcus sp. dk310]TXK47470.1 hypothetical protein FVP43_10165 [Lactococcus sp. dk322]
MEVFILVLACAGACYLMMSILKLSFWLTDLYFEHQSLKNTNASNHIAKQEIFLLKKEIEELKNKK